MDRTAKRGSVHLQFDQFLNYEMVKQSYYKIGIIPKMTPITTMQTLTIQ